MNELKLNIPFISPFGTILLYTIEDINCNPCDLLRMSFLYSRRCGAQARVWGGIKILFNLKIKSLFYLYYGGAGRTYRGAERSTSF